MSPDKTDLRRMMKTRLGFISAPDYRAGNDLIRLRFLTAPYLKTADVIMLYCAVNNEVETRPLILELLKLGKTVCLPVCLPGRDLAARRIVGLNDLTSGRFGIPEPLPDTPVVIPGQIDLIVLPGLAFDKLGNRLGHGAGYYDRFLIKAPHAFKLGLAYEFQVLEMLPVGPDDVPMDAVLTEQRIREFGINKQGETLKSSPPEV